MNYEFMLNKKPNKKDLINLDSLNNKLFEDGFIEAFCERFIPKLQEFATQYRVALFAFDTITLREIVHTMMSSLRFLDLEHLVQLLNQYKQIDFKDKTIMEELAIEVEEYCAALEEKLLELKSQS